MLLQTDAITMQLDSCVPNTAHCTYRSSCFRPEKKSTLSMVADMLGAAGGFAGK